MPAEKYLTLEEAAQYLRISDRYLRKETTAGNVPVAKIGRRLLYTREDLDSYVAARRAGGPPQADTDL